MSELIEKKQSDLRIDELEAAMLNNLSIINCPLTHRFTEGLYVREIFMPAGSLITSKIHKTQHQFFILKGAVSVWNNDLEEVYLEAPYIGITEPGTRRILYIWEDCIWATSHPNPDNETVEEIEERILEKYDNPLLSQELKEKLKEINSSQSKTISL